MAPRQDSACAASYSGDFASRSLKPALQSAPAGSPSPQPSPPKGEGVAPPAPAGSPSPQPSPPKGEGVAPPAPASCFPAAARVVPSVAPWILASLSRAPLV